MKTFQQTYTTIEQSKRLLELGLPRETADMYYCTDICDLPFLFGKGSTIYQETDIPCWSVGRLIEIITICKTIDEYMPCFEEGDNILDMVLDFVTSDQMDFSKLED